MFAAIETLLQEARIEARAASRLAAYGEMLLEANRRTNLTGAKTPEALVAHLLDSLTLVPFIAGPLVDVGSGAGLPAIPLALVLGVEITMIEATAKKAAFLELALRRLDLRGEVVAERAETAARSERLRDAYPSGTCRAVASGTSTAELLLPFVRPSGLAVLQRGKVSEAERAAIADAALVLGGELEGLVNIPNGERSIVLLRKTTPTPPRFPRRVGVAERRPLCWERST